MKVLVFIDHDIIYRHFIRSGALAALTRAAAVTFIFPDDGGKRMRQDPGEMPPGTPWLRLSVDAERQQTWRWALFSDQLKWRPGDHEAAIRKLRWSTLGWKAALLLTLAGLPVATSLFGKWIAKRLALRPNHALADLLERERPDAILHPCVLEGVFINDLVLEGRARGIPVVLAMNSWDNPSTKRAVVGRPDWLLVWGPQTKAHAIRFMAMAADRVLSFGAAQFDVFRSAPRISRTEFCATYGFDPADPVILFAGANTQTDEVATMAALDAAIADGRLPRMSILYRPHPWGGGGRGGERLLAARWKHIRLDEAMRAYVMRLSAGGNATPEMPDYAKTHDTLAAVDAVVSPLSTMLLEAMLHGKAAICFLPEDETGSGRLRDAIPMLHFEDFLASPEVANVRSVDELIARLPVLVDARDGAGRAERLREAAAHFVTSFDTAWGERLVEFLQSRVLRSGSGDGLQLNSRVG